MSDESSKVKEINNDALSPEVIAAQIDWKNAANTFICVQYKSGDVRFWVSAKNFGVLSYIKIHMDLFFHDFFKTHFQKK